MRKPRLDHKTKTRSLLAQAPLLWSGKRVSVSFYNPEPVSTFIPGGKDEVSFGERMLRFRRIEIRIK